MAEASVIACNLKLRLRPAQERLLNRWLWHLTGVYNWALRKIELDARDGIYHSSYDMESLIVGHSRRMHIEARVIESTVRAAYQAWDTCFKGRTGKPRLKGRRRRLAHIIFRKPLALKSATKVFLPGIGPVSFHKQDIPSGKVKCGRVVKRASGWYLCLFVEAQPQQIKQTGSAYIGIDPGFSSLLTFSTGERISEGAELRRSADRLAQAQRGNRRALAARLQERIRCQRKDRNHKLSRRLVAGHSLIAWSKDPHVSVARRFGKSVANAAHGQLRDQLAYKCRAGGRQFIEVPSRNSTKTCSDCGALTGPTGLAGLSVRQWACGVCGAQHDRDVNAAKNTLTAALGMSVERLGDGPSGIATHQHSEVHRG